MKLIIVRHGETLWNKKNKLQGKTDNSLSKIGLQQARNIAKMLSSEKIDLIYTSKLKRAVSTATEIKRFHKNIKLIKDKALNEMSWGAWEGLRWEDVKKRYKNLYAKREKDKFNFKAPKGEGLKILKARLKKFLSKLYRNKNKAILIVGHLNVNRVILGTLLKLSDEKLPSIKFANDSVTILSLKNKTRIAFNRN